MFSYIAGVPLSEYLRRRRMTLAAFDLQNGGRVLDVALRYGYESPTAFNRAFQSVHGVSPSAAQRDGAPLKAYPRISFKITVKGEAEMDYRIIKQEAFRIVGVREPLLPDFEDSFRRVPEFWGEAAASGTIPRLCLLMDAAPKGILGVSTCMPDAENYYYIAVASTRPAPEGMHEYVVPACTWAVFPGRGSMPAAMQELLAQEDPVALHGYCPSQGDPEFRTAVAAHLNRTFGLPYAQKDIFPTTGAAGAIAHALRAVTRPGDEVLTFAPYFPEYGPYVEGTGAHLRVVPPQAPAFQPNLEAFEQMLTEKVTCVLINTPNNPTGVVYSADTLTRLAEILTEKSRAYGHNIFLVSDEPYRDIAFDGRAVPYPAAFYPHTLTCFSFSKSLSLPGERLGYVAVCPGCEGEEVLVDMMAQISRFTGHNCPPSIIQRAVSRCLDVTSDLGVYETNMNLLYNKLKALGFEVERPGGTFYLFPKALEEDANAFCRRAREFDLLLVPSDTFGVTGYVRLAYCIDTEKVKRSLPALEKLAAAYR